MHCITGSEWCNTDIDIYVEDMSIMDDLKSMFTKFGNGYKIYASGRIYPDDIAVFNTVYEDPHLRQEVSWTYPPKPYPMHNIKK